MQIAATAFNTWLKNVEEFKRQKEVLQKVLKLWQNRSLGLAYSKWMSVIDERKHQESMMKKAVAMWFKRSMIEAFNTWQTETFVSSISQTLTSLTMRRLLRRAIVAWSAHRPSTALSL